MSDGRGLFYVPVVIGPDRRSEVNNPEAKWLLAKELAKYAALPYGKLIASFDHQPAVINVMGESGALYQIEVSVCWDSKAAGDVRIMASIDDGGWRSVFPLTDSVIMKPDGTLL